MRFEFHFNLIGKWANHDAYSNFGTQVGTQCKDFGAVWQTNVARSLVPSAAQATDRLVSQSTVKHGVKQRRKLKE